jgi:hypothetical protein
MKELFSKQEATRKKPIDENTVLTTERNTLAAKVKELEGQLSEERVARQTLETQHEQVQENLKSARSDVEWAEAKRREEKSLREVAEKEILRLKQQVRAEEERRTEAEKRAEEHSASTKAKLEKASAFTRVRRDCLPCKCEAAH